MKNLTHKLLAFLLLPLSAYAAESYKIATQEDLYTGISFSIGYSMGTHKGKVVYKEGETTSFGEVVVDLNPFKLHKAVFSVPVKALKTPESKLNCHMREALTLDYSKSHYPDRHICDREDELPESGVDAPVFNDIRFEATQAKVISVTPQSKSFKISLSGKWSIHGITKTMENKTFEVTKGDGNRLHLRGAVDFKLKDYGIVVKNLLFIEVDETAQATLDLWLEK